MLGVDEFVFVDLRFRLGLGARGVSATRKPSHMNRSSVEKLPYIHCTGFFKVLQNYRSEGEF